MSRVTGVSFHPLSDGGLVRAWDELAEATEAGPFMRHGWFEAWARAFGVAVELAVARPSDVEAVLPVIRRPRSVTAPVNEETPEFSVVAASASARDRLLRDILSDSSPVFEFLKVGQEDAAAIAGAARGLRVVAQVMQRSPFLEITDDWTSYESALGGSFRQGLRRKARRLQEQGDVRIECHDGHEGLERSLDEGFAVESSQWKARQGTAIASRAETKEFYTAVARWAAERGWLRLWFLRLDDAALAFRFDLQVGRAYYHVKGGYDPASARYSPGLLLQHETVKHAFGDGLGRYEFLGADEPYKLNWTKTCHERVAVRAFGRGPRGTLAWIGRTVARPLAKRVRDRVATRG